MKTTKSIYFISLVAVFLSTFIASCASFPEEEVNLVREKINNAETAEANLYVYDKYKAAEDSLIEAETEIHLQQTHSIFSRDFSKASRLLEIASNLAEQSIAAVPEAKNAMRTDAALMLIEAETKLEEVNQLITVNNFSNANPVLFANYSENSAEAYTLLNEGQAALDNGAIYEAHAKARQVLDELNELLEKMTQPAQAPGL